MLNLCFRPGCIFFFQGDEPFPISKVSFPTPESAHLWSPATCKAMRTFACVSFFFFFFGASAWHRKPPQVYSSSVVYTPRHAKTSSHPHPQKQSLGLRHNKEALACIPPARSWLLLRVIWQAGLVKVASLFEPPTEDGHVGHVSRGEQKAQTASQYSSVYS